MDLGIDIVVTSRTTGRPELVVAVRVSAASVEATTHQLSGYMARAGVPLGLVVAGSRLRLLRDSYEAQAQESIKVIGDFETGGITALRPPNERGMGAGSEFEARVQSWLESLAEDAELQAAPASFQEAVREHLLPVLETGTVSAAGPRASLLRAS